LLAHRGFTHSLLFCVLITPVLALSAEKWHRPHNILFSKWIQFFAVAIFFHIFLDAFNNYGTGWFEPFSHVRISFNTLYVADPFFSIWPMLAVFVLVLLKKDSKWRSYSWKIGFALSSVYLLYALANKRTIDKDAREIMNQQQISYKQYFTTPAPLQNWLWYIVAGDEQGFHVGFRSLYDGNRKINFEYFPKNDSLLNGVHDQEIIQKLKRFSQGFYTVSKENDTLLFNDLRFGQIIGWQNPKEQFVFHFYLQHPDDNKVVVQRGRFAKWDNQVFKKFIKRIIGD
jgi:inner membrane protein